MSQFPKITLLFIALMFPFAVSGSPLPEKREANDLVLEGNLTEPLDLENRSSNIPEESPFLQVLNFTKGLFENVKKIAEYVGKVKDIVVKVFEMVKGILQKEEAKETTTTTTTTVTTELLVVDIARKALPQESLIEADEDQPKPTPATKP